MQHYIVVPKESFFVASDVVHVINFGYVREICTWKCITGLQVRAFKNCSKLTPAYKDYEVEEVYILNKCSSFNWITI